MFQKKLIIHIQFVVVVPRNVDGKENTQLGHSLYSNFGTKKYFSRKSKQTETSFSITSNSKRIK
jgi:hypothetical protein